MASANDQNTAELSGQGAGDQTTVFQAESSSIPDLTLDSKPTSADDTQAGVDSAAPGKIPPTLDVAVSSMRRAPGGVDIGEPFGDYELVQEIARGGMGVVYRARQRSLNRTVALKMILEGQLSSETAVQRFYKEAEAAAGLDHPNIVPIYEIGQHAGRHYFTMAFIEGASLRAVVQKAKPTIAEALNWTQAIAEAVAFAHQRGFIHRDLKPDNILIDQQNRPRITDFGLAKRIVGDVNLTGAGQILGTPSYMAPEQALGGNRQVGPGADVYAIGGILYYLLTGKPPILGDSVTEVLCKVVTEPPIPPQQLNVEIPDEVQRICLCCLEKEPGQRYPSAAALATALHEAGRRYASGSYQYSATQVYERPAAHSSRLALWMGLGFAVVVLLALGLFMADPFQWFGARDNAAPGPGILVQNDGSGPGQNNVTGPGLEDPPWVFDEHQPVHLQIPEPKRKDFGLQVTMGGQPDKQGVIQLKAGQEYAIKIVTDENAYVGVWSFEADGAIQQIFPNESQPDGFIKAKTPRIIPDPLDEIKATPSLNNTVEYLRVVASSKPLPTLRGTPREMFQAFETLEQRKELASSLRGLAGKAGARKDVAISEQVVRYLVRP